MNAITKHETPETLLPADPMVSMIERVAMDPNADLAKLERMLEMRDRHEAREAEKAFAAAFASASAEFPTIPLRGDGHNKMKYATLKDITSLTRPVLSKHGLALTFQIETRDKVVVTAQLMHRQGHSTKTSITLPADTSGSKNAVQAIGSTQTYGQRYTAQAILGLSLGDDTEDDGRGASASNTITSDQYIALRDKAEIAGVAEDVLCKAHSCPDLHQFPSKDFAAAMARLDKNIASKGGAK